MSNRRKFDWSDFTDPESCLDLYGYSVRWGLSSEEYSDSDVFRAVALTDSFALTANQLMAIDGGATGDESGSNRRYAVRARIIGDNSPHAFLPDVCDPAYTGNEEHTFRLISMHTLFTDTSAFRAEPITRGDIILVRLFRTGQSYDLQYGTLEGLMSMEDPANKPSANCSSLVSTFGTAVINPDHILPVRTFKEATEPEGSYYDSGDETPPYNSDKDCREFSNKEKWRSTEYQGIVIYTDLEAPWTSPPTGLNEKKGFLQRISDLAIPKNPYKNLNFADSMIRLIQEMEVKSPKFYQYVKNNVGIIYANDSEGAYASARTKCGKNAMSISELMASHARGQPFSQGYIHALSTMVHESEHFATRGYASDGTTWAKDGDGYRTQNELDAFAKEVEFLDTLTYGDPRVSLAISNVKTQTKLQDGEHWKDSEARNQSRKDQIAKRETDEDEEGA